MTDMLELIEELQESVHEDGLELDLFILRTDASCDIIEWDGMTVFDSENSDRDSYEVAEQDYKHERTIREQVILELKAKREDLDLVISKLEPS